MQYTLDMTGQSGWSTVGFDGDAVSVSYIGSDPILMVGDAGNDTMRASDTSPGDWLVDSWDGLIVGGGDDVFTGASGNDTLEGEDGNDNLTGNAGNDLIYGGAGTDTLSGGDGNDLLLGHQDSDVIYGGAGDDRLGGLVGDDSLYGGDGADIYHINSLADVVSDDGATGWDRIVAHGISIDLVNYTGIEDVKLSGTDALSAIGNEEGNLLMGNAGANTLSGLGGQDLIRGGMGNDSLYGGDGQDWLHGNPGADLLDGGLGADTLMGGYGRDTLTGGEGADVFVFHAAEQTRPGNYRDTITDFTHGEDVINLSDFMTGAALVDSFSATGGMEIRFDATVDRLMGDVNGDGTADWAITLTGVDSFSASDLLLIS